MRRVGTFSTEIRLMVDTGKEPFRRHICRGGTAAISSSHRGGSADEIRHTAERVAGMGFDPRLRHERPGRDEMKECRPTIDDHGPRLGFFSGLRVMSRHSRADTLNSLA
jgi:hypothetical protein